jgi:hypothetical protein
MVHFFVSRSLSAEFQPFSDYRFGRVKGRSARSSLYRFSGVFRRAIAAIVDSKLRRMERELELVGIHPSEPQ